MENIQGARVEHFVGSDRVNSIFFGRLPENARVPENVRVRENLIYLRLVKK